MKSKMREKVRPKMGKIDIDYQKLHDAFFKWQTKPKLTIHGDLYYEVRGWGLCRGARLRPVGGGRWRGTESSARPLLDSLPSALRSAGQGV